MIRGTTPDYILTIEGYDLTDKTVYVTITRSDGVQIARKSYGAFPDMTPAPEPEPEEEVPEEEANYEV